MLLASRLLRIQKGEGRLTAMVVILMLVAMAGITIGESGIEALFFDRVGPHALPLMYVLQGGATFAAMLALTGILGRLGSRRLYLVAPLALGGLVLAERVVLIEDRGWVYRVLWITVAFGTLVQATFLWGTAGAMVDTRQAKRLFPVFGAGGILGSVIGGIVTRPLASAIGTENLLLIWAGGLVATFMLTRLILGPARLPSRPDEARRQVSALRSVADEFTFVRRSRLLRLMTIAAVLFSVLFYLVYLPYARAASEQFPDAEELAGFFGLFWAAGTTAAFLVSVLATNRLFGWFGMAATIIILPALYTMTFGILLVESGLVTLVALRFVIGVWLQGVAQPGWEVLTNVIPEPRRNETRAFLIGGPSQLGTVIAGVLALVGQDALTLGQFATVGLVAAILTIVTTVGIRRSYIGALVDALSAGRPRVFGRPPVRQASVVHATDADSVRVLTTSTRSSDVHVRRLAFQILAKLPTEARPPKLVAGVEDEDAIVRLSAVQALDASTQSGRGALLSAIDDCDSAVAAAAAARALGLTDDTRAVSRLRQLLADQNPRVRRAAVGQLMFAPADRASRLASELLTDSTAEVRAAALERLAAAAPDLAFGAAVAGLRDSDPAVRIAAGRALGSARGRRVEDVLAALQDRRTADAAVEAVRRVKLNGDGYRVRSFVRSAATRAGHDRDLAAAIPRSDDAAGLLHDAILDRGRRVATLGLWAATILGTRREEMHTAIENLDGPPAQLATALETLETAGDPRLLRPLLTLWESAGPSTSEDSWLPPALDDKDDFVRHCAEFVRARRQGDAMPGSVTALSVIERVLFLRKVPLFADLAPADLERVAELAEESAYAGGEVIAAEGELGDELYIVVQGTICVVQDGPGSGRELARRTTGDIVGEMSIITRAPRMASLVADEAVRAIRLGHREFESMLRERPSIALAVMRVLAQRLAEAGAPHPDSG